MAIGLTNYGKVQALPAAIGSATTLYVALFTTLPDLEGANGVEASGSGYARKSHASWVNVAGTAAVPTRRVNNGAVEFAALTGALTGIVGFGIYDAVSGGNLIAIGQLVESTTGLPTTVAFANTDQPRFVNGELQVS